VKKLDAHDAAVAAADAFLVLARQLCRQGTVRIDALETAMKAQAQTRRDAHEAEIARGLEYLVKKLRDE
jgi:hypothetical protein